MHEAASRLGVSTGKAQFDRHLDLETGPRAGALDGEIKGVAFKDTQGGAAHRTTPIASGLSLVFATMPQTTAPPGVGRAWAHSSSVRASSCRSFRSRAVRMSVSRISRNALGSASRSLTGRGEARLGGRETRLDGLALGLQPPGQSRQALEQPHIPAVVCGAS